MSQIDDLKTKFARLHALGGGTETFTVLQGHLKRGEKLNNEQANNLRMIINDQLGPEATVTVSAINGKTITFQLENFDPAKLIELTKNFQMS
jgi:hypothetical protein